MQTNVKNVVENYVGTIDDGIQEMNGNKYMADAKGHMVPIESIKPVDILEDEIVRKVMGYAQALNAQIERFKGHTFEDLGAFEALLAQEYNATKGGAKGNKTFMQFDGLQKVQVAVSDHIDFGPQLQIAKSLIDECLNEWAADSSPHIRAVITRAFNTDKKGQINKADIFMLMRLDIDDPRWLKAVEAIRDAIRIVGSKTYIRFYKRKDFQAKWENLTIDIAKVS